MEGRVMRKIVAAAVIAATWLAVDAASARAQILFGPVGYSNYSYGYRSGFGFGYNGRHFGFGGSYQYFHQVSYPNFAPIAVGPWGAFGGIGVVPWGYSPWGHSPWGYSPWGYSPWAQPFYVAPQVFVVQPPVVVVGANDPWAPRAVAARPPEPLAFAAAAPPKVDAAVRRGDLLVVRPNGEGLKPLAGFAPVKPPEPLPEKPPAGFAREVPPVPAVPPADPKARSAFEVGRAKEAFAAGAYGRAAERLADAIKAAPNEAVPYFLLAQAYVARGEYAAAVATIKDGFRRDPDWPAAAFQLNAIYGPNAAALDEHLKDLSRAAAADGDDPTLGFLLGYHEWFRGRTAEAVRLFKKATKLVKDNGVIERFLLEAEGKKF